MGIKYCVDRAQKLSSEYASRTPFFSESIHLGLFHISDMLMRRLSNLGTKGERNLSNPPVKLGWERVVRGSSPSSATTHPSSHLLIFLLEISFLFLYQKRYLKLNILIFRRNNRMMFVGQGKSCLHSQIVWGPFSIVCITHISTRFIYEKGLPPVMHR